MLALYLEISIIEPMSRKYTKSEIHEKIEREVPFVDIKPFSHNLIGMLLGMLAKQYGQEEANKAIDDYELEELGWSKVK